MNEEMRWTEISNWQNSKGRPESGRHCTYGSRRPQLPWSRRPAGSGEQVGRLRLGLTLSPRAQARFLSKPARVSQTINRYHEQEKES